MTLLEVEDLHVTLQIGKEKVFAVRGISYNLKAAEMLGIVGESGSGKTVAARSLMRLLRADKTEIRAKKMSLSGIDLMRKSNKEYRQILGKEIAMIFQDPMTSLNPVMKIGHQVEECVERCHPKMNRSELKAKTLELLSLVKLPYPDLHYNQYPFQLSGGMKQRVAIAMAVAFNPKVIIADEPTTALDMTIQGQILDLIKELQHKMGTSVILITHDLKIVARYCDRVNVMYAGKIVESATTKDLFENPSHPYTELLLKSVPRKNEKTLTPIDGCPPNLKLLSKGCSFAPRCPFALKVCALYDPKYYNIGKSHYSGCWRHDPSCPNL